MSDTKKDNTFTKEILILVKLEKEFNDYEK